MKAGVAMAVGMTLLIPTFNAINNSYAIPEEIPPWLPSQLPDNLKPPTNLPTPPPDWQPPPDWEPPEGWEDWEPPPDWEGKLEGYPPPPGECPPPVWKWPQGGNATWSMSGAGDWTQTTSFVAPQYTAGIVVVHTISNWRAAEIMAEIDGPQPWGHAENRTDGPSSQLPGLTQPTVSSTMFNQTYDPRQHNNQLAGEGTYTITATATPSGGLQSDLQGTWRVETKLVLPCGGAFQ